MMDVVHEIELEIRGRESRRIELQAHINSCNQAEWDKEAAYASGELAEVERTRAMLERLHEITETPTRVCLCGSTRFSEAFQRANLEETLAGRIVLTIGCDMRSDAELFIKMSSDEKEVVKARLDELHLRKIDLAHQVLILNVDGYIGESTRRELAYARQQGKVIRFLEPESA